MAVTSRRAGASRVVVDRCATIQDDDDNNNNHYYYDNDDGGMNERVEFHDDALAWQQQQQQHQQQCFSRFQWRRMQLMAHWGTGPPPRLPTV